MQNIVWRWVIQLQYFQALSLTVLFGRLSWRRLCSNPSISDDSRFRRQISSTTWLQGVTAWNRPARTAVYQNPKSFYWRETHRRTPTPCIWWLSLQHCGTDRDNAPHFDSHTQTRCCRQCIQQRQRSVHWSSCFRVYTCWSQYCWVNPAITTNFHADW